MPAPKSTATSLLAALVGTLGFSALAGVLVTVMVAPALAVTGVTANNTVGIFNALPEYIALDPGSQQNQIVVHDPRITDPADPNYYQTVATIYKQNREEVTLDQISPYLQCAAVAGEDRRFYEHGGVDAPSLLRAAIGQVTGDDSAGGASTLSMQTVRNILQQQALNDDSMTEDEKKKAIAAALNPSIDRKIKEMKLAIGLEKNYTKDEILAGYLNIAGFGGNTYGVQAAAYEYFGTTADQLTIAQAASLLAIVQYPNARDLSTPDHYKANQDRRDVILTAMYKYGMHGDEGCISKKELDEALATPVDESFVSLHAATVGCRNAASPIWGFVCDYAKRAVVDLDALGQTEAERKAAWEKGGYKLVLTIDPALQQAEYDNVNAWAPNNETRFQLGSAAVSVQVGTGNILAMAQNKNFDDDPTATANDITKTAVNFAVDQEHGGSIGFQPGSTYKPYVLLAFLAAGHGVGEIYNASVKEVNQADFADSCPPETVNGKEIGPPWGGPYTFRNDSGESGPYNIVRGTAGSVNSVFIQMAKAVDQCNIAKIADSLGVHNGDNETQLVTRPSCSIGGCENSIAPLQQAAAYAAIAGSGIYCQPRMIADVIVTATGNSLGGEVQKCGQSPEVTPEVANTAAYAMKAVMGGTGAASNPQDGTQYIGKTGTTNGSIHTWMVGSSTTVATAVWVGNVQGEQALRNIRVSGQQAGVLRHRIFKPIAQTIDQLYPGGAFPDPDPALLKGQQVEIVDLTQQSPEAAKAWIELNGLEYADGGQVDSDLPAGQVARTDPGAGSQVSAGSTVTVYTSNGLAKPVPTLVGMTKSEAEAALDAAEFHTYSSTCVGLLDLGDPTTPPAENQVMSQDPVGGGARNPASTAITFTYFSATCV